MAVSEGDIIKVAIKWRHSQAGDQVNTYHLGVSDVITGTNEETLAAVTAWALEMYDDNGVTAYMSNMVTHDDISVFNLESGGFPIGHTGRVSGLDGSGAPAALPSVVAALMVLRTAVSGRVGRKYLPTMTEDANALGQVDDPAFTVLEAMAADLAAPYTLYPDMTLSVLVGGGVVPTFSTVIQAQPRREWARIGTRKAGRGS